MSQQAITGSRRGPECGGGGHLHTSNWILKKIKYDEKDKIYQILIIKFHSFVNGYTTLDWAPAAFSVS
jgi:hypothetical protein